MCEHVQVYKKCQQPNRETYNKEEMKLSVDKAENTEAFETFEMMLSLTQLRKCIKTIVRPRFHISGW